MGGQLLVVLGWWGVFEFVVDIMLGVGICSCFQLFY